MNRLDRRITLLRAKREGTFDRDQYWLEGARRARIARLVRSRVRRMAPVVLLTPRWSAPRRFLDDVATDLLIGTPEVVCRTLDCAGLKGLTNHQAWAWLVEALAEVSELHLAGPAWQAVSRMGFQHVMTQALDAIQAGHNRRGLLLHGLQHIPIEALEDLVMVYEAYRDEVEGEAKFTLVLAGSISADHVQLTGAGRPVILSDYTPSEAVEALVEDLGPLEAHRLQSVVDQVGGIPQVLEAIADQGEQVLSQIVANPDAVWSVLGALATEIRGAYDIVASDDRLNARLELLAKDGPQSEDSTVDPALVLAGMANHTPMRLGRRVQVRAPVLADLALSG